MMRIFELTVIIADLLHQFSMWYLLMFLFTRKSCGGVSGKSQLVMAVLYTARYLDVWTRFISLYLTGFKIACLICNYLTVLLIFGVHRKSYRHAEDTFATELLLVPCFFMALWFNFDMTPTEILWTFSQYLEAIAIVPQFYMIYKNGEVEKSLLYYLVPLGLYRLFYIFYWIYRYQTVNYFEPISALGGFVYVSVYAISLIGFYFSSVEITNASNNVFKRTIFPKKSNDENNDVKKMDIGSIHI